MALKCGRLLKNIHVLNKSNKRSTSQYYPIDEYIFGLTYEQIQVRLIIQQVRLFVSIYLIKIFEIS